MSQVGGIPAGDIKTVSL